MNPFVFVMRRPVTTLMLVVALIGGGVFGLNKMRAASYPSGQTPKVYVYLDTMTEHAKRAKEYVVAQYESHFHKEAGEVHAEHHKIVVTTPKVKAVVLTLPYVCLIHSQRHIEVCALEGGYLKEITVREGQAVKKDDSMFRIVSILYETKLRAEQAKAQHQQLEFEYATRLAGGKNPAVSAGQVALAKAEFAEAEANVGKAQAELDFTNIKAPFDGIVDRLERREGSLIKEGDILTTLSDNSVMWVYFNVPEAQYLGYMADLKQGKPVGRIELKLADGNIFSHPGELDPDNGKGAIEAKFDSETGNIKFRADFRNPDRLLRNGQTGTVLISRTLENAMVIPQRATFENLAKRYVYIVGKDDVVHQREIYIQHTLDDIFVVKGLEETDKIVLEGTRQVRDGEKVEYEMREAELVLRDMKNPAE